MLHEAARGGDAVYDEAVAYDEDGMANIDSFWSRHLKPLVDSTNFERQEPEPPAASNIWRQTAGKLPKLHGAHCITV
jgi:hypothetical protein